MSLVPRFCDHCGGERAADGGADTHVDSQADTLADTLADTQADAHAACTRARGLEPPRFCPHCRRRMVVQVVPRGWTARCSEHGAPDAEERVAESEALIAYDREHLWHPYSSMAEPSPVRLVESASGVRLRFADGTEAVDGMSSWWAAIHGYRHPVLDAAARAQLDTMSHVMFGGLTHEPAVRLAERLVEVTPDGLEHVFLADSGSVSVEVALKACLQYQRAQGRPRRTRVLTIRGGYHGDTFGAMSMCDPVGGMHALFRGILPEHVFAPRPPAGFDKAADDPEVAAWAAHVEALAAEHEGTMAAVVVEPVLQGAGGMYVYSPACLQVLRHVADRHGLLLVLDEIATGFGRTGTLFASEHAGVRPDVLCLGKALTGGYLTMAAMLCTAEVARGVSAPEAGGALMHGPTFMANPLAASVARASLDLLLGQDWQGRVHRIEGLLADGLAPASGLPGVKDVRVLGAVGAVQLEGPVDVPRLTDAALRRGVWVRPFRDLVYTMPPYVCTDEDVRLITDGIVGAVGECLGS
ncbi:MAG: adenosylmethionine--8-amino-7-oxononanoate transaminase [Actinomycetes bacterium]